MAIEIVDFPSKNGDFPVRYVNVYQRVKKMVETIGGVFLKRCISTKIFIVFIMGR
jgi:hypothetical protein